MNLINVKKATDIKLDGVETKCEFHNGQLVSVELTDAKGQFVKFGKIEYSFGAWIPAPPEKKSVPVVSGKVKVVGTEIREAFEDYSEASQRERDLRYADVVEDLKLEEAEVEIPF
jgi:hypothetical protein